MKKIACLLFFALFVLSAALAKPLREKPLTVVLDWYVNPDHAPLLVAQEKGYFKQEGIKVKIIAPADPSDGPKLVAAKKADVAISYQPQLLLQIDQGWPLMRFGVLIETPLDCLVTLKASGIQRIEDLKGRAIGCGADGGVDSAMLAFMLRKHGLSLKDVKLVNVHYALVQALLSGNVAAFTGAMCNVEPIQLEQSGYPVQVFYPKDHGVPPYDELIWVAHRDATHDPRLPSFLKALQKGAAYLKEHPQESWEASIKRYPELDNALNKASWFASIQYFSKNPAELDKKRYRLFAEFMQKQGLIKQVPPLSSYTLLLNDK